jgi:glycosyltransferase involved in cell wall biosynthesis
LRITIVTAQLLGFDRVGGVGTATAFLTLGLARSGHSIDVAYIGDADTDVPAGEWSRVYGDAGVSVRRLAPDDTVEPRPFRRASAVERALRADPPEAVIAHEFGAPAYAAQRLRQLGLGFEDTLFVVFCHGTRRWVKEVTRNTSVSSELLLESALERASVELADVVVSPSAFMLGWMRDNGWSLPEASRVIPYLTRSGATGEAQDSRVEDGSAIRRVTYFGRLEEIKGIGPFLAGLKTLDPALLRDVEIEFLGTPTKHWTQQRVQSERPQRDGGVSFQTGLDQPEALARLLQPGTLAVMPSLADNSPNAVYECLERGIPFVAGDSGGIAELVAPDDRSRVLFEPTAAGVAEALEQALRSTGPFRPARPAFDGPASLAAWAGVLELRPLQRTGGRVDESEWGLVVEDEDEADPELFATLTRAQGTSGADVVTCGLRTQTGVTLFAGEACGLEVLANHLGAAALVRRTSLGGGGERVWPLLTRLSAEGAHIVSAPLPLVSRTTSRAPEAGDALRVVEEVERMLPREAGGLARLVAGLAADAERRSG